MFLKKITLITQLPLERKFWLLVCFIGSLLAWFAIRFISMRKLASLMGSYLENRQVAVIASDEQQIKASRIGRLMNTVSKNVPWECKCLSEALCVKWLLNYYKIPSVFYLGARLDSEDNNGMKAHAWVTVGPYVVIGGPGHKDYQAVATFTTPPLNLS
jgi:hypothetical protein